MNSNNDKPILYITSPMPPSINHYLGHRAILKNGKPMAMVYETKEAKDYKKEFKAIIEKAAKEQNWTWEVNDTQHFYIDAVFYFDRIDKDCSNYEKCLGDTITETQLIWKDDNVAMFRPGRIYYDNKNPRIELTIYPVDYIGIFDNQEELNKFKDHCSICTRGKKGNCSIFKKAIEGRVQENINGKVCCKYKESK